MPLSELRPIVSIGLTSLAAFRLVTSVMSSPTEGATIIDPLDRLRPGLFEVVGTDTDHGIGLQKGSIVVNVDGHAPLGLGLPDLPDLLEPLVPLIPGIVDIAVQARDRVVSMRGRQTFPCLDGRREMCQRYRSWFWKKSIGSLPIPFVAPSPLLTCASSNFILHVENAFRNRGLRVDVLVLGPRIPLGAAVHRQYVEGVLAVVRLSRPNQFSRKIPLQIFDRSSGPSKVRFSGA